MLFYCVLVLGAWGCGSSSSIQSPTSPAAVIGVTSWLVDVGGRYQLSAGDSVDPENASEADKNLSYQWTIVHSSSSVEFDDYCEDSGESDTVCSSDDDCSLGDCGTDDGWKLEDVSFVPDRPGPYTVRLTVTSTKAAGTEVTVLDTYPSLFVVDSLSRFGGTAGLAASQFSDADEFAEDASYGVTSPSSGNILLVVPDAGVVREFSVETGLVVASFGETGTFVSDPVALAFDSSGDLYVAQSDGAVKIFDGSSGLYLGDFGDVAGSSENVTAMAFSPDDASLVVVDGGSGEPLRYYDTDGTALGDLGTTSATVSQAADLAFLTSGSTTTLLIADAGGSGDLLTCDSDGTDCDSFGSGAAAALLASGGPSAVTVNPAASAATGAEILVADAVGRYVVGCSSDGTSCAVFGATSSLSSAYDDILFAPASVPTTTTTTTSTTTTTL